MSTISINRIPTGGFSFEYNNQTVLTSKAEYVIQNNRITVFAQGGFEGGAPFDSIAVNEVRDFASAAAVAEALDAIGFGKSSFEKPAHPARGTALFTGIPADTDTITIDDGVNTAVVFEFSGIHSAGAVSFIDDATPTNPSKGDTITFADGDEDEEITFEFDSGTIASGTIEFSDGEDAINPKAGEKIVFDFEGDNETIFEFVAASDSVSKHNKVVIGLNEDATMAAFIVKFNAVVDGWTAVAEDTPDHTCTIVADAVGVAGNVKLVAYSQAITTTDVSGGLNPGQDYAEGNIPVVIGANVNATMANFILVFNAFVSTHTAKAASTPNHTCTIKAVAVGVAGDVTMSKVADYITVTSPTGGADAGDNATPGNIVVEIWDDVNILAEYLTLAINEVKEDGDLDIHANAYGPKVTLTNLATGPAGNETITTTADEITVTGMAGGANAVTIDSIITALAALVVE